MRDVGALRSRRCEVDGSRPSILANPLKTRLVSGGYASRRTAWTRRHWPLLLRLNAIPDRCMLHSPELRRCSDLAHPGSDRSIDAKVESASRTTRYGQLLLQKGIPYRPRDCLQTSPTSERSSARTVSQKWIAPRVESTLSKLEEISKPLDARDPSSLPGTPEMAQLLATIPGVGELRAMTLVGFSLSDRTVRQPRFGGDAIDSVPMRAWPRRLISPARRSYHGRTQVWDCQCDLVKWVADRTHTGTYRRFVKRRGTCGSGGEASESLAEGTGTRSGGGSSQARAGHLCGHVSQTGHSLSNLHSPGSSSRQVRCSAVIVRRPPVAIVLA